MPRQWGGGFLREKADIYVRNKENLGYAKAVNEGLKLARTKFIAVANNDVRVSSNWQAVAREILRTPKTYSCHFRMTDYEVPFEYGQKIAHEGMERWCTSSFFVISSNSPYLYDENFGIAGYEDYDYWWRVRKDGWKTAYTTKAVYQHHHSFTQNLLNQEERVRRDEKSREYFKQKWGEYPDELFKRTYPEQWAQNYYQVLGEL